MATWAVVSTICESREATLNYAAHHIALGALEVHVFLDDPEDAVFAELDAHPKVVVTRCDAAWWADRGGRPDDIEQRQRLNARAAYAVTKADWLGHLDSDEFLSSDRAFGDILDEVDGDSLRLRPFERLAFTRGARGGEPTHMFRGELPATPAAAQIGTEAYQPFQDCLRRGLLSHRTGKFFVRAGVGAQMNIHHPRIGGSRPHSPTPDDARLLHLHGGDWEVWRAKVGERMRVGAYNDRHDPKKARALGADKTLNGVLSKLMREEGEAGLKRFFDRVCAFDRSKRRLGRVGALFRTCMWLDDMRADVFGEDTGREGMRDIAVDPGSGEIEGNLTWRGLRLRVAPQRNVTERRLAVGAEPEAEELALIGDLAKGRKVLFYDIGANAGIYALSVARDAAEGSVVLAFEPNPEMLRRLTRNVALNGFDQIRVRPVALSDAKGKLALDLGSAGTDFGRGQVSAAKEGATTIEASTFTDEAMNPEGFDLSIAKVDVEGHEAQVIGAMLDAPDHLLPQVLLVEWLHSAAWGPTLLKRLEERGYREAARTSDNILFRREPG